MTTCELVSVDRGVRRRVRCEQPDRYRHLFARGNGSRLIARGAGLSYVAAAFGGGARVVCMRRFNRVLGVGPETTTIEVEGGVDLGRVHQVLARRGRYLPVQPGHPQITIGGCIACNVHGKNQHREGLFDTMVERIRLFHPAHGLITLAPDVERGLFDLTCGGFGLTGIIVSARLRTAPLPANAVRLRKLPVTGLEHGFQLLDEHAGGAGFLYSWHDLSRPHRRGRGYVVAGRFEPTAGPPANRHRFRAMDPSGSRCRPRLWRRETLPLANEVHRWLETRRRAECVVPVFDALFPITTRTFYYDWYGRDGFVEAQMIVPHAVRSDYARELQALVRRHGPCVVLCSCKVFNGPRKLLNFAGAGICLNVDVVRDPAGLRFLEALDDLNDRCGALTNLAKDSRLERDHVIRQYGAGYERFHAGLREFDPGRLFVSALSERMGV